jgi:hypothetical protein
MKVITKKIKSFLILLISSLIIVNLALNQNPQETKGKYIRNINPIKLF